MTSTFSHPLMSDEQNPTGFANLRSILLEPLFMLAAGLFWLAVLPITGVFCAGVAVYDKMAALKAEPIRLPDLRSNPAHNPLVLRKSSVVGQKSTGQTQGATPALQS